MGEEQTLYLFGDQTFDIQPSLRDLLRQRSNPVLERFLTQAYDAIRSQIYTLPVHIRDGLPRFTCVDDLILSRDEAKHCIPLDMATTCMYHLGAYIIKADLDWPKADSSRLLGLCTGSLAAAAVSCSRSPADLIPLAIDAVVVAFKTGMHVTDVAERVEPSRDSQAEKSWSMIIGGSSAAEVVARFSAQSSLPLTRQPYVSAQSPTGVTVSGPPNSLAQLKAWDGLSKMRKVDLPIYGPYHSSQLSSEEDVLDIVSAMDSDIDTRRCEIPLVSSTGTVIQETNYGGLMRVAVRDILLRPISWSAMLDELKTWLSQRGSESFKIKATGTTADQLIYNALKDTSIRVLSPSTQGAGEPHDKVELPDAPPSKPKLAIIGLSGRYPGAKDNAAFWDVLHQGLDMHKEVPPLHWDAKTHVDPTGKTKNTSATPFGCWLDNPAEFDARFFNISPREAAEIDPAQRIALMTAYEAIEESGLVPDATASTRRDRVGVFYGVTSNDWMETNSAQNISTYFIPGGNRAFIPGRINYCFKFSGPSYAVDTACSSSLAGIHIACNALWRGDIDTAIAGGTNILTNPDFTAGLDRGHFLSRTGNCKTFDDDADGYCRGEGVGTVIIKRLDDAIADNDPIQGVILGAYTNHSAESESITRPHVGAQRAIFKKILNQGAVDPYDVGYVEMHGTGTQAGDAGEMSSVLQAFAPPLNEVKKGRTDDQSLYLGSAKANIGHGEAVSGVSALIKVLLMMKNDTIVPHCGIKNKINSKFPKDLDERNVNIAREPTAWDRKGDKPRRAFVNNFSAAGGNSAILLEDAPLVEDIVEEDPRSHHLVAVSGKNGASLQGNLKRMLVFLEQNQDVPLGQLSYTTTARRIHHLHRVMISGANTKDMRVQLQAAIKDQTGMVRPKKSPKVIQTFTGNGAQYPGMGRELFETFSFFRSEILRLDRMGQKLGFPSILPVIQSEEQDIGAFAPTPVQLATTCMQMALSRLWSNWGVNPAAVVGHSLGEYAALNVAGVLSDIDTIHLVGKRAQLLEDKCTRGSHSMLVIKADVKTVFSTLKECNFEIACINSPVETVVAGPNDDIYTFQTLFNDGGIKSTLLKVPYAFHSSQVDPILDDFTEIARNVVFSAPSIPILCPLDGTVLNKDSTFETDYFSRHCRFPVNMLTALENAHIDGVLADSDITLEIGPHPAISGMVKANLPKVTSLASLQRGRPALQTMIAAVKTLYTSGSDIRWYEYHRDFKMAHRVVSLPAYSWDLKEYWLQYVNDWSLRKGDPPLVIHGSNSKLESTTIHKIVEENGDDKKARIIVEADIARKDLSPLVQGHEVDGIPLCTPSVYCDIALSLGKYLLGKYKPRQEQQEVDVGKMDISKALILNSRGEEQPLQAQCDVDWSTNSSTVKFMSFDAKKKLQEHARCVVRFTDRGFLAELEKNKATIKQKMQALREGIAKETTARFNRPMVYRAIRPLARFHDDYRAIDEIVLNSKTLEASSKLSFGTVKRGGDYHTHPAIIDALTQACGFTMNCNDGVDLDTQVFMNHGWGGFQIFEPIDFDKSYTTYTQMHEGQDKLWHGDVAVFDEADSIVAAFKAIAIQGVPRRVLKTILSLESKDKLGKSAAVPPPAANATQPSSAPKQAQTPKNGKKPAAPAKVSDPAVDSKVTKALAIIADESGLAPADLSDETVFADAGVDSLMGLTISSRFADELDLDLDMNSLFFEYPTVKDLKGLLGDKSSSPSETVQTNQTSDSETSSDSGVDAASSSAASQPDTGVTTPTSSLGSPKKSENSDVFDKALEIIAQESGVAVSDLTDDTDFADSGVDSLLSLVVTSRFRDELELDINHESLFLECPTVGDLRKELCGDATEEENIAAAVSATIAESDLDHVSDAPEPVSTSPEPTEEETANLAARKKAVDELVTKYISGFAAPDSDDSATLPSENEKVVLVTGATGSLGGHLTYHLAQLGDVKTVICLNRENKTDASTRQYKAMREKGIRFPEELKSKLHILQTDSAKPMFGLEKDEYENLVGSVTHVIHNAWTMSAKKALAGFESQFQTFHNLLDFASSVASRRPSTFKLGFQMVSSIGVVGHYDLNSKQKTVVPEDRVLIDSVLPNGYSEAKWGCERMLDETLHKHSSRFRTMVVRLGQIAGSKTSGYWNPTEHFGFLIKSSQTLNALPDLDGGLFWTSVNDIAAALSDLVLADNTPQPIYHIENPVGQSWKEMTVLLADALHIPTANIIPFPNWLERVKSAPPKDNPATMLLDFLDDNFLRMSCGGLVLDTKNTVKDSASLAAVGPVSDVVARKYIHIWREIGFLKSTAEDRARLDEDRVKLWGERNSFAA